MYSKLLFIVAILQLSLQTADSHHVCC